MNNAIHKYLFRWLKSVGVIAIIAVLFNANTSSALAAVAFQAGTEAHTGTTGSTSAATFTWSHVTGASARGVVVFVWTNANADYVSTVTYGGVTMTEVSGGQAADAAGEPGRINTFFLGASIPSGNQTVVVNRTNNATIMSATAVTVTAATDTEVTGIVLAEADGALVATAVNDGSTGVNSLRVASTHYGGNAVPGIDAASSTDVGGLDPGNQTFRTVRETTAGQGSRNVGFSAASDDRATVHLAIREIPMITLSGVIYQSDETTAYQCLTTGNLTVALRINGAGTYSGTCTANTGAWTITFPQPTSGQTVYAYLDGGSVRGTSVLVSNATTQTNVNINVDDVILRDDVNASITNTEILAGNTADTDDLITTGGTDVTVGSTYEIHIYTADTYAPGANVSTGKLHVVGTYSGNTETLTLTGSGTGTARPLYINGGTFTAPATSIFQGTSATDIEATTFNALSFTPTITGATTYALLGAETINGNFTINPTAGTTQLLTVNAGGTITVGAAYTTTISGTTAGTSVLDLRPVSTDYNLSTGKLDVAAAGTLDAGSTTTSTITLTSATSTLFTLAGAFTAGGSTVIFNPDAAVTLTSGTFTSTNSFNNISLTPAISTAGRTYTFGSGAIETTGDFLIQPSGTQLLTVNMAGNITVANNKTTTISRTSTATSSLVTGASNPALSSGNITVAVGGTLNGTGSSSTVTLTANGTPLSIAGTYTPGSTTIAYVPASTTGVTVASTTYYNVTFNKASNTFSLAASGITATNDLTITAGVLDAVSGSNYPITVGRNWTNTPGTGGFLAQNGTVTFNTTTAATITGATIFYSFTATTAPKTIKFGDATTFQINGLLTLTGSAGPNYITLDSVTGGSTQWTINHQGTENITYTSVKNSACDGTSTQITVTDASNFNAGNNGSCWLWPVTSVSSTVWKLDEGYGDTINDSIADANDGTLAGTNKPTWQTEDMCISGNCLYFEGTTAVATAALDIDAKTVSFWVRPMSTTTLILQLTSSVYIHVSSGTLVAQGFSTPTIYVDGRQTSTIQANRWQHVTVTTGTTVSGTDVILGNNSTSYFKGFLDEVKFDGSEYTAAQVKGEFTKRGSIDGVSAQFGNASVGQQLSDGLVGYWKLDESSGNAADSAGNSFTLTNNGTTTYLTGKFGKGSEHVPASSQYLSGTGSTSVNTYYFDGSDVAASGATWTNPSQAYDGNTTNYSGTTSTGQTLSGTGTTAPTSGDQISQVRTRVYGCAEGTLQGGLTAVVRHSGNSLSSGQVFFDQACISSLWSGYSTASAPSGGWTWQKVNDLEMRLTSFIDGSGATRAYSLEAEVTSAPTISIPSINSVSYWTNPDALTNYYVNLSSSANIQSNSSGVISANGFTDPKIYVNGVQGATLVANQWQLVTVTSATAVTVDDFTIGKISTNYFDGTMDEVRLYNRTLSSAEVATIYAFAPAPIGYWKMDENTGTSIVDVSGNGASLSTTNSPGFAPGKFGSALNIIPGSSQYASRTDIATLSQTSNMTLSTWIKPKSVTAATLFPITGKSSTSSISYLLAQYGDEMRMYIGSSANYVTTNASNLSANTWYHVEAVYTASAQTVDIYINGIKAATTTTGTIPTSIADGTDDFAVGYYSSGSGGTTLSPVPEVGASTDDGYQNTSGLSGDVTNTEVRIGNSAGNAQTSGFRFTSIGIPQGATITSATFKPTSQDTYDCVTCTLTVNVKMEDTDDAATFSAVDGNISGRTATTALTAWNIQSLTANVQYSVDVTSAVQEVVDRVGWASGNDMAVLVIDNGSDLSEWQNIYSWDHASGAPAQLTITYGSGSSSYYDGAIDDVKLYNYTRTQTQVIEDMNGDHPVGGSPVGSQVAYWKLDEGSLTTLYDTTPNGNNATLQSGNWTASGKFGRALDFELGSTNYASLADNTALSLTGSMTLSAWIKPESTTAATNFPIVSKGTSYALTQYGDELRMYVGSVSDYKTTDTVNLQPDTWYHVQGVYDATSQTVALYVNGVAYPGTVTGTIPSSISDGASAFDIGRLYTGTSYQFPILATGDDGIQTDTGGWINNQNYNGFGYYTTTYNNTHAGLRFQDVTIAQGTSVSSAYISVYGNTANSVGSATNIDANIIGDDVDSASAWVNGSSMPSGTGMTDTTAVVAWNPSTWTSDWINTPDISSIVQEILNRGGWASGNEMRFAIRNDTTSGLNIMSFEDTQLGTGRYAVLNISTGSSNTYYDGVIDEIKVYATALSPSQASLEFLGGKSTNLGSTSTTAGGIADSSIARQYCVPGDAATCNSPLAEWRLDENTGTTSVADTGSTGYTGTMTGLSATSWVPGKVGSALQFNGSTTYVTMATEDANFSRDAYSMSAWVYRNTDSGAAEILIDNRDSASDGQLLQIGASDTFECYYNATASVSTTAVAAGNWYHVTCTANGTTQKLYVNGIQEDSDALSGSIAEATDLRLGARSFTSAASFFPGILDEVRLYDYALSSSQVAWNFNRGGPLAWYKMDEGADTTINDSSGNGLAGTLTLGGSPTTATAWTNGAAGKINSAMSFDGTDDRIEKTNDAKLNPGNNFTLAAWVKPDTTAYQQIINKQHSAGNVSPHWGVVYRMFINNGSSTFDCGAFNGTTTVTVASPANAVQTSTWQHVACTLDGSNLKIYVNGKQVGSSAFTGTVPTTDAGTLYIGARTVATTSYFDGLIDDAQIFGYSMTDRQINNLYNNGAASFK